MTIKDQAKKIATGAGVAIATTGLSNCNNGGAVDPLPPALQCNTVNSGQGLVANVTRSADTLNVTVKHNQFTSSWRVDSVTVTSGSTLVTTVPPPNNLGAVRLVLRLASSTTTQVTFGLAATVIGYRGETCSVQRNFTITISPNGVQISSASTDELPLAARQRANIMVTRHEGHTVELSGRRPYIGSHGMSWNVRVGELDGNGGAVVRWTLPREDGVGEAGRRYDV